MQAEVTDFETPLTKPCWTDALPRTDHVNLFRQADYGLTKLGPIADWPLSLRNYVFMVFTDSRPACVYWGEEKIAIYNEGFAVPAGKAHPNLIGKGFLDGFPELWPSMKGVFERAASSAQTVDVDNILLFPERKGFPEETYFIGQFIPLRDDDCQVGGFYNTVCESTDQILHERRRLVVENIAAMSTISVSETVTQVIKALAENPNDITMCLLYSYVETETDEESNIHCVGRIGILDDDPCAPQEAILNRSQTGFTRHFRRARDTGKPVVLSHSDDSLASVGTLDKVSWCGYGEPSRDVTILALSSPGNLLGFLVVGNNPRRLYDDITQRSLIDMARQIEAKWAASISTEQFKSRERILEQRAMTSESKLQHMAKYAPIGMCQFGRDHTIHFANDLFYEITGLDRAKPHLMDCFSIAHPDEIDKLRTDVEDLLAGSERIDREVRFLRKYVPPVESTEEHSAWIMMSSFPLFEEDGTVKLVLSYVLNISHQKWTESVQTRVAAAALLAKRQQEEFIDTTSHEMRNPLTAILQLADGISQSMKGQAVHTADHAAIVRANIDSANTILACAAHQKRIIDDVLILSRLESDMLSFSPIPASPVLVVHSTLRMFSGEVKMNSVSMEAVRNSSYDEIGVDHTLIDPSRLAQVLINLLGNAIKFTVNRPIRRIRVYYGASEGELPVIQTALGQLEWSPPERDRGTDSILPPCITGEEPLYLWFYVEDSGPGMTLQEMKKLFKRFSQANSRTHIEYGGSGIGLYICQKLVEKQDGGVGVASKLGEGSIFGFYVETRRATGPPSINDPLQTSMPQLPRRSTDRTGLSALALSPELSNTTLAMLGEEGNPIPERPRMTRPYSEPDFSKLNLLLVEDNLINQRILAKQLRYAKCTVTVANHGREALQLLEDSNCWARVDDRHATIKVDVILLDWEMPIMNGLECCEKIRRLEKDGLITRSVPVIAITANVRREQVERAMLAGFDAVMPKPFTVAELLEKIREVVDLKQSEAGVKGD